MPISKPQLEKIRKPRNDKGKKRGKYNTSNTNPIFKNEKITLYQNDCIKILSDIQPNSIDAIVTDPPYGISFQNQKWDYNLPSKQIFQKILHVMKPGGTLLCFASPRTQHRMAINIEDAGFEIRDCLMWLYGSGLPKSQSIKNLITKYLKNKENIKEQEYNQLLEMFESYRTHALKPAYEPIIMAMKPLEGNYAENAIKYELAGLNIEECRLENKGKKWETPRGGIWKTDKNAKSILVDNTVGRFPTNLIYEDNKEVIDALVNSIDESMNIKNKKDYITKIFYCAKVKGQNKEGNDHPTIKPLPLMRYLCKLIKSPSKSKDCIVLDPFMGSGSTGVACLQENIKFIGIEKEQNFFNIAQNRIQKELNQPTQYNINSI